MLENLLLNRYEAVAVILSGIGLTNLLLQRNMIKKIIGLNIMDAALYLFLAAKGYVAGRAAPLLSASNPVDYVNPIPAGLVLTGIVVSVSVTAFALALTVRLYDRYGTLNIDEALLQMRRRQETELQEDEDLSFDLLREEFRHGAPVPGGRQEKP